MPPFDQTSSPDDTPNAWPPAAPSGSVAWPPAAPGAPSAWPPSAPPGYVNVWPPPPSNVMGFGAVQYVVPFKTLFVRIEGPVIDFRTGVVEVTTEGVRIIGKAVQNNETQIPILIVTVFLRVWLIAAIILEYAFRKDKWLSVPWGNVKQVGLDRRKGRICLLFDAPNHKGVVRPYSLAFKVAPADYEPLTQILSQYLGARVAEVKMRAWQSPASVMFLTGVAVGLTFFLVAAIFGYFSK